MQARLRAQLGDQSISSGERRRRSVVVASIVLTITDPLRGSYTQLCYLQAALICSCGASFACMELTIICRFQRLLASTRLFAQSPFYGFSVPSPLACSQCVDTLLFALIHAKGMSLRYDAAPPPRRTFRTYRTCRTYRTTSSLTCRLVDFKKCPGGRCVWVCLPGRRYTNSKNQSIDAAFVRM